MRRALILALVAIAVASAVAAVSPGAAGPGGVQRAEAAAPTIASLKRTFTALLPDTTCDAGAAKRAAALKLRAGALRHLRTATPAQLKRKRAAMRKAVGLLRQAKAACAAAPPAGPGTPAPGPPVPPNPPGTPAPFTITLHVAPGNTTHYTETSASAPAGAIHLSLVNASNLSHFISVRTAVGHQLVSDSPLSPPGGPTSQDVTLAAGAYEIFCHNNGHDLLGMVIPFTVG